VRVRKPGLQITIPLPPLRLERMARGGPAQRDTLVPAVSQPEPETLAPTAGYPAR
jgi:hypothetical protein